MHIDIEGSPPEDCPSVRETIEENFTKDDRSGFHSGEWRVESSEWRVIIDSPMSDCLIVRWSDCPIVPLSSFNPGFELIDENGDKDDDSVDHTLHVGFDTSEVHAVSDDSDDGGSDEGAGDFSGTSR